MRSFRIATAAVIAVTGLVVTGCASDNEPSADDTNTSAETTPSDEASETPSEDATDDSTEDSTDDGGASADVGDFPDVDGYTLVPLPQVAKQTFAGAINGTPQIDGFEGRVVQKGGQEVGFIIRVGIDEQLASSSNFEEGFFPGFAAAIAGGGTHPQFEEMNGVNVIKIEGMSGGATYAWVDGNVATVATFDDPADAQAFAQGATGQ